MRESGFSVRNVLFQLSGIQPLFRGYLETAKRYDGHILVPSVEPGHDGATARDLQMVVHESIGTVLAIVPFDAPLNSFACKVASALAAGNAVVVKPTSDNPLALLLMAELLWQAGVPCNAIQVLTGRGEPFGVQLHGDARINAITLTDSTQLGVEIA